ncbi:hypothetical protein SANTM175S_02188 [Streptomyces antimycoticus]
MDRVLLADFLRARRGGVAAGGCPGLPRGSRVRWRRCGEEVAALAGVSVVAALLEASPEFAELWRSHEVDVTHHEDLKRYRHRELGELELYCQRLDDALDPDCCRRRGRHPGRTAHRARRLPRSRRPSSRGCPAQGRPRAHHAWVHRTHARYGGVILGPPR